MRKIIIDTSPLVIHLVGVFNNKLVEKVSIYKFPDDELRCVERLMAQADDIVITPYVFGELFWLVNTRLNQSGDDTKKIFIRYMKVMTRFKESFIEKNDILDFKKLELGPTDVSLFLTAKRFKYPILTSDREFIGFCKSEKVDVISFQDSLFNL
jgi:predicted nucleic acid-binding protein